MTFHSPTPKAKIAITVERDELQRVDALVRARRYPNRSRAFELALRSMLDRVHSTRLAMVCAILGPVADARPAAHTRERGQEPLVEPVRRGDIRLADVEFALVDRPGTSRVALVLSHDVFNERTGMAVTAAIGRLRPRAGYPLTFRLDDRALEGPSWVRVGRLRTVATQSLRRLLGRASPENLEEVLAGVSEILGSPP